MSGSNIYKSLKKTNKGQKEIVKQEVLPEQVTKPGKEFAEEYETLLSLRESIKSLGCINKEIILEQYVNNPELLKGVSYKFPDIKQKSFFENKGYSVEGENAYEAIEEIDKRIFELIEIRELEKIIIDESEITPEPEEIVLKRDEEKMISYLTIFNQELMDYEDKKEILVMNLTEKKFIKILKKTDNNFEEVIKLSENDLIKHIEELSYTKSINSKILNAIKNNKNSIIKIIH